jgi:hypothetical protein
MRPVAYATSTTMAMSRPSNQRENLVARLRH